ncbi:MAG: sulfatase [Deltaproteobacteria bacterium]|nr:sulfatase [Deltaproteobacteria bacterium]
MSVGAVGGLLFGSREGVLMLHANAAIQPGQYFWLYLGVPVLSWMALGVLLAAMGAVVALALRLDPASRAALGVHTGLVATAGSLSVSTSWREAIVTRLRDVGSPANPFADIMLWALVLAISAAAALVAASLAAAYMRQSVIVLRIGAGAAVAAAVLLLLPVGRFLATDWKWEAGPRRVAATMAGTPNVLLISIDTLRADHLGCYGDRHHLTPRIDRLAHEGTLFEQAISASSWTLPAVASILTGLYPRHHGAGRITNGRTPLGRSPLPRGSWTLATALHARGYRTNAIVTNPYLGLYYNLGESFDGYENITIESEAFLSFAQTAAVRLATWLRPDSLIGDRGDTVSRRAARWLETAGGPSPFLLWLHYLDPHPPYGRSDAIRHKSMRGDLSFAPADHEQEDFTLTSPDVARLRSGEIRLSAKEKEAVRELYRAEVASVDAAVGAVLDALDRHGLRDRTLVILVADHGEEFWEHGGVEHGHTVYDELVHVPLLMRWPGHVRAAARVAAQVSVTDIAPTIVDLLGFPVPPGLDGVTIAPVLRGEPFSRRAALSENMLFAEERTGFRTATWKYIRWSDGKEEVYNLADDAAERRDLVGVDAVSGPLRVLYADLVRHVEVALPSQQAAPDERADAALRALGYLR